MACGVWSELNVANHISPARVLLAGMVWRGLGLNSAGETLVRAVSSGNEQNRALAGISLIRAGERSVGLIAGKVANGEATPQLVRLLVDFESSSATDLLNQLAVNESSELSDVATECLQQLDRMAHF